MVKDPQSHKKGLNKTRVTKKKTASKAYECHWVYWF